MDKTYRVIKITKGKELCGKVFTDPVEALKHFAKCRFADNLEDYLFHIAEEVDVVSGTNKELSFGEVITVDAPKGYVHTDVYLCSYITEEDIKERRKTYLRAGALEYRAVDLCTGEEVIFE